MNKISGPVSIYYLKPINTEMPLVLMFGDIHGSYENMCSNCTCESEGKDCCHEVYDTAFLKKLDRLSTPATPVDFYVEYFDDNDGKFSSPLDKFREPVFRPCYNRSIKRFTECPAPNIRWQYSDVRFSKIKNNIEQVFDSLLTFVDFSNEVRDKKEVKGISSNTWKLISDCIHGKGGKFDEDTIAKFVKERPEFATKTKNIGYYIVDIYKKASGIDVAKKAKLVEIIETIAAAFNNRLTIDVFAQTVMEYIFRYDNTSEYPSLIYKQFVKQKSRSLFATREFVSNAFQTSYQDKLSVYIWDEMDKNAFESLSQFEVGKNYDGIDTMLLHVTSTFVDIYTILRMMKDIRTSPALSIAYFGDAHVKNICSILIKSGGYTKAFVSEEHNENRCINYSLDEIDVVRDFKEHTQFKTQTKTKSSNKTQSTNKTQTKTKSKSQKKSKSKSRHKGSQSHKSRQNH